MSVLVIVNNASLVYSLLNLCSVCVCVCVAGDADEAVMKSRK